MMGDTAFTAEEEDAASPRPGARMPWIWKVCPHTLWRQLIERMRKSSPFTDVALVSDGRCGSTCAVFTSSLLLSRHVTVFTYGGLPLPGVRDQGGIDSSSFAGGNVESYQTWWPKVVFSYALGHALTEDRPMSEILGEGSDLSTSMLPLPLPTLAQVSFTYRAVRMRSLGANSLPREFYALPGHRHLGSVWQPGLGPLLATGEFSRSLHFERLYDQIISEDWAGLRNIGRPRMVQHPGGHRFAGGEGPADACYAEKLHWPAGQLDPLGHGSPTQP